MRVLAYLKVPGGFDKNTHFPGSGSGCGKIGGYSSGGQETALWVKVRMEFNSKGCKILVLVKQRSEQEPFTVASLMGTRVKAIAYQSVVRLKLMKSAYDSKLG